MSPSAAAPPARIPPGLWPKVSALFDEALAVPAAARASWLAQLDASQPALAPPLRSLLAAHATVDTIAGPDGELLTAALGARVASVAPGSEVGIYRLMAPLGQGGMATVWAAQQQQGVHRRVALKLPHAGIEAPAAMARRFELERDLLASLEHPHIARLYDAGLSAEGQPFLAMELIEGQPITTHCAGLALRRRLVVFLQVLSAVSFAHGRLVIHRDLKPSNILVTPQGQVKLLDFGIARLLGEATDAAAGGHAFTPDGASPEQLAGEPLGAVSDVYSLAVLLYELLTGQRPYVLDRHAATPLAAQLAAAQITPPSVAAPALRRALAGDLDAIVARAMAFNPAARYPSVEALAADLHRHLDMLPVLARGSGRPYRAALFFRRHRLPLAAGAAAVVALAVGLGVALWQAEQARGQALRALAVKRFLVQVFDAATPEQAQGRDVSAKTLLDHGARRLATELPDQPEVRADLHAAIGRIYVTLGDNAQSRRHVEQALALYAALGSLDSEAAIDAQLLESELLKEEMQYDAARAAAARTLERAVRAFGPNHRWALPVQEWLAWIARQQGDTAGAEALVRSALAAAPAGSDPSQLLRLRSVLGSTLLDQGRYAQARDEFAAVVAASADVPRYETTDKLADRYNLARARFSLGEFERVATDLALLVPEMDRHLGPRHDRTLKARALWAQAEAERGRYTQALALQRANLGHALARETFDADVASLQRLTLAKLLRAAGRYGEGLPLAAEGQAFFDLKYPQPTWLRERGRWVLGELQLGAGRVDEALATLELAARHAATLADFQRHTVYADLLQSQALALRLRGREGDSARAGVLMAQAEAIHDGALGAGNAATRRSRLHRLWLAALAQPASLSAVEAFEAAAAAWSEAGPLAAGETALMRAEWFARAGRAAEARLERARGAALWQQALDVPWPGRFTGLH